MWYGVERSRRGMKLVSSCFSDSRKTEKNWLSAEVEEEAHLAEFLVTSFEKFFGRLIGED
jgi:hypothetical protein